jgi:hypothetical protein
MTKDGFAALIRGMSFSKGEKSSLAKWGRVSPMMTKEKADEAAGKGRLFDELWIGAKVQERVMAIAARFEANATPYNASAVKIAVKFRTTDLPTHAPRE